MVQEQENICLTIGGNEVLAVVYGNELDELKDLAVDAGGPFWYIMGTDAWLEKETCDGQVMLILKNHEKIFCSFPAQGAVDASLQEETGILVLFPEVTLDITQLQQLAGADALVDWLTTSVGEAHIDGLIFCFYTEQDKAKYHNC